MDLSRNPSDLPINVSKRRLSPKYKTEGLVTQPKVGRVYNVKPSVSAIRKHFVFLKNESSLDKLFRDKRLYEKAENTPYGVELIQQFKSERRRRSRKDKRSSRKRRRK